MPRLYAGLPAFAQEQFKIPSPFASIRIGSVVMKDGRPRDAGVFDLLVMADFIIINDDGSTDSKAFGNSRYELQSNQFSLDASIEAEANFTPLVGASASGYLNHNNRATNDAKTVRIGAALIGVNRVARIDFGKLSLNDFMSALSPSVQTKGDTLDEISKILSSSEPLTPHDEIARLSSTRLARFQGELNFSSSRSRHPRLRTEGDFEPWRWGFTYCQISRRPIEPI